MTNFIKTLSKIYKHTILSFILTKLSMSFLTTLSTSQSTKQLNLDQTLSNHLRCRNPSLGLVTKARGLQGCGPRRSLGVTPHVLGNGGRCEGANPHTPKATPTWEMESRWTPEFLEGDCRGQNSMAWSVPYIIGKLLERRCLKWARIAHLHIWNTSYGQKKGQKSNWQFDSRPLKVENQPNSLAYRQRATYHWKAFDKGYNFVLDLISIGGLLTKLWRPNFGDFKTPTWESRDKKPFGCGPRGEVQSIL
jgi:hypothetical protein